MYPQTRNGATGGRGKVSRFENGDSPFSKNTADKIGVSRTTVEREIQIANNIAPEIKDRISEQVADSATWDCGIRNPKIHPRCSQ